MAFLFLSSFSFTGYTQIRFEKTYASPAESIGYDVIQTPDNGFMICGTLRTGELVQGIVMQTNAIGDTLWTKLYDDALYSFCAVPGGGYIFTGWRISDPDMNLMIMKTDENGNIDWEKSVGTTITVGRSLCQTADSGFCIVGETTPSVLSPSRTMIVRIDRNGDTLWTRKFGDGTLSQQGQSIISAREGGFVICGTIASPIRAGSDMFLLNVSTTGDLLWMKTYNRSDISDMGCSVIEGVSGGYFAIGNTRLPDNSNQALWLVRTNEQGDTLWTRTLDTLNMASPGIPAVRVTSLGFALAGVVYNPSSSTNDILLKRFDDDGNIIWSQTFGSMGHEYAFNLNNTSDGGFVVSGSVWISGLNTMNMYLAKTDDQGHVTPVSIDDLTPSHEISIFPDPTYGRFTITSTNPILHLTIVDLKGVTAMDLHPNFPGNSLFNPDITTFPDGMYILKINTVSGIYIRKLLKM